MNELQSVFGLFVVEKGEKIIYKKYSKEFRSNKVQFENRLLAFLEGESYSKENKTEILVIDSFAVIYLVMKDFALALVSDQDSENQVFVADALDALEACIYKVIL